GGDPEEVRCNQRGKRGTVSLLRDFGELVAESIKGRIAYGFRKRNRNRLVWPERRRGRLNRWSWRCRRRCLGGGFGLSEGKILPEYDCRGKCSDQAQAN